MQQEIATGEETQMFVDGSWVESAEMTNIIHPYSDQTVRSVPLATDELVHAAVDAAARAQDESNLSAHERYRLLSRTAELLSTDAEEMAHIITAEQGKPITEARGEVDRAVQTLQLSAEEAKRLFGEAIPMDAQRGNDPTHSFTQQEPLGVVAAITPFNFPLNLLAHKIGPALAAGNSVIAKPALSTPLCAVRLFEYLDSAAEDVGAPDGLVNLLTGEGSTVGDVFLEREAVEAITFTGSTAVGKHLADNAGMKELTLELGGNDPTIVWGDADIEAAAAQIVAGACTNAGQVCNSVERVIVDEAIESELTEAVVREAESLRIGDPFDEQTDIGSLIHDTAVEDVTRILEESLQQEATVECGGDIESRIVEPTVLSDVTPDMPAAEEEVFGPLIPIVSIGSFDEAIRTANDTEYGLEAGVFTQDLDRARHAADDIDAGTVNINSTSAYRTDHMPYGGFKQSGKGKEGVKYAVEHFTRTKLVGFHSGANG